MSTLATRVASTAPGQESHGARNCTLRASRAAPCQILPGHSPVQQRDGRSADLLDQGLQASKVFLCSVSVSLRSFSQKETPQFSGVFSLLLDFDESVYIPIDCITIYTDAMLVDFAAYRDDSIDLDVDVVTKHANNFIFV
ncbi:hypothetical protein [Pseudomonas aeruginosa]|uniref:hypothetical protein n=2 Tax=Pseudomonas aeruginosa TaxID=287 RepID=UPI00141B446A|nr:hypothetical protein [Pseudomonas aeruginosa]EIU2564987.1 hypothetical protein [Pseudomonas aeruginosa]EIU2669696.1 hypothetical protein [Pseudomonas aeruginosa]EIU2858385.1 hypothetical protein [Pseudomonas aeruginosa]EIU2878283.1 hypothetical protein [Pseudomonas aeruginosa]EKM6336394.1 hypothetical protein [Pseudomonas aeruginosa]